MCHHILFFMYSLIAFDMIPLLIMAFSFVCTAWVCSDLLVCNIVRASYTTSLTLVVSMSKMSLSDVMVRVWVSVNVITVNRHKKQRFFQFFCTLLLQRINDIYPTVTHYDTTDMTQPCHQFNDTISAILLAILLTQNAHISSYDHPCRMTNSSDGMLERI